ncbi:MAG: hypothetical protein HQL40_19155 [Alphaproteobacteria bacterium]|nr:hypothetical protein [Alphaproteobacteria bacterium]
MRFTRDDFERDVGAWRRSGDVSTRARGDNFAFDEHVGPDRLADFESFDFHAPGLKGACGEYFQYSIVGVERTHVPSTFASINERALRYEGMEDNQKIVRLERIDDALGRAGHANERDAAFDRLTAAMGFQRDESVIRPILRQFEAYTGARPAFACFHRDVAKDLKASDWLPRLIARLGLGHHLLQRGQRGYFALMIYTVGEVREQARHIAHPFAVPTVLESRDSPHFYPAPYGRREGYAVDLDHRADRVSICEFLHARLSYQPAHLVKVGRLDGPAPDLDLAAARDAHLRRLRDCFDRPDFGALMAEEAMS